MVFYGSAERLSRSLRLSPKTGKAVYIECKLSYNKPSEEQVKFIEEARAAGALAAVCYSVEDAVRLVTEG